MGRRKLKNLYFDYFLAIRRLSVTACLSAIAEDGGLAKPPKKFGSPHTWRSLPPTLVAVITAEAWTAIEPLQQHLAAFLAFVAATLFVKQVCLFLRRLGPLTHRLMSVRLPRFQAAIALTVNGRP